MGISQALADQQMMATSINKTNEAERDPTVRNTNFYDGASIFVPNKFLVGFYGEYVGKAIKSLKAYADKDSLTGSSKDYQGQKLNGSNLTNWLKKFQVDKDVIEMKWAAMDVDLPTVKTQTDTTYIADTTKTINFPLVTGHGGTGTLTITVVEDRDLMWHQFFNALLNEFYSPLILKPKSSYQKMSAYCSLLHTQRVGDPEAPLDGTTNVYESLPAQTYEYNSIVLKDIGNPKASTENAKKMTFGVSFECPNLFQQPFKQFSTFRGIADNVTDQTMMSGATFNISMYEDDEKSLKAGRALI